MIWAYLILFAISILFAAIEVPVWGFIILLALFIAGLLLSQLYPLLWQKDPEKVKKYLKKSKQPYHRFLSAFLFEDEAEAENRLLQIKQATPRKYAELLLFTQQERWDELKQLLQGMKKNNLSLYYSAVVALEEGRTSDYEDYKNQLKDRDYVTWLSAEQKRREGNKETALTLIEKQLKTLRGLKILSAQHYINKTLLTKN